MTKLTRYNDTLVHPGSELAKLIAAGETKKAEELYQKVRREAIARGEFLPTPKEQRK